MPYGGLWNAGCMYSQVQAVLKVTRELVETSVPVRMDDGPRLDAVLDQGQQEPSARFESRASRTRPIASPAMTINSLSCVVSV